MRVLCLVCGSTHALIPEFSLPGTSIGTEEADRYLHSRQNGISQTKASKSFIDLGMSQKYGVSLEKKVKQANRKAMVLFPKEDDILHKPILLFGAVENQCDSAIRMVNSLFLEQGYNPLYFSRNNILRIREIKTGTKLPLNKRTVCPGVKKLDSS